MAKTRTPAQRGRGNREKGARGERKVLAKLITLWSDMDRNIQDRGADRDGPDLFSLRSELDGEVKHRKDTSIQVAIRDAIANARKGRIWFAVDWPTSGPRKKPIIVFDLDGFIRLIRRERARAEAFGYDVGYEDGRERARDEQAKRG